MTVKEKKKQTKTNKKKNQQGQRRKPNSLALDFDVDDEDDDDEDEDESDDDSENDEDNDEDDEEEATDQQNAKSQSTPKAGARVESAFLHTTSVNDSILTTHAKCLNEDILCSWKRVPFNSTNQPNITSSSHAGASKKTGERK